MGTTCSSCGVVTAPEARFCRHCGAVLKASATLGGSELISPLAQTIPLDGSGHATSGLSTNDVGSSSASDTQRVDRAEMERILRRSRFETTFDKRDEATASAAADYAAPQTGELKPLASVPAAASAPAQTNAHSASPPRSRRAWGVTITLLLATLCVAALAYYFVRQRAQKNAGEVAAISNSNSAADAANVNSSTETVGKEEAGASDAEAQPGGTPQPTPKPSASIGPPRGTREREADAPALATSTPQPVPTAAPVIQATPTPPPTPASGNGGTPVEATADAFFFQAVNLVNARDPRSLQRAELLRALQLFQNVKSGTHAAAARREAERLGKELDRRRKYSQP